MKVIKPLKQGILYRTFENDNKFYFVVTVFNFFPFSPAGQLHSEIDMWKFAPEELGKEAMLDLGMPKPKGEVVISGKFFSPNGKAVTGGKVRVKLAGIVKTLYVFGDRYWKRAGGVARIISDPIPITTMDIAYENAFGGPEYKNNPLGKGHGSIVTDDGEKKYPLPNIEDPRQLIGSPHDKPEPASFAPLDFMWPQRFSKAGTFDEKWLQERFPGLAEDLDWTFYNTAPVDQQIDGFFEGNESFEIEGMHPHKSHLSGKLPEIRSRCFINHDVEGNLVFKEIMLHPDTVWLFPHAEKGIVTYRGTIEVGTDDAEDIKHLLLAYERFSDEQRSLDHYQEALSKRLDKEKGHLFSLNEKDLIPPGEKSGLADIQQDDEGKLLTGEGILASNMTNRGEREKEKIRDELVQAGLDPEKYDLNPPEAPEVDLDHLEDLEEYITKAQEHQAEAEEKARKLMAKEGLDYDRLLEDARRKPGNQLKFSAEDTIVQLREMGINDPEGEKKLYQAEEMLKQAYKDYGHYFPAAAIPLEEEQARMREVIVSGHRNGESLAGKDFTGVNLANLDLGGINLQGAFLEGANLSGANLEGADFSGSVLVRANLSNAKLVSAKMTAAGLGEADLSGADVSAADLAKAVMVKANVSKANFSQANLDEVDFSEAKLTGTDLTGANLKKSRFMECDLSGSMLSKADLSEALFLDASVKGCDFSGTNLSSAILIGVTGDKAVFREAELTNIRILNESSFQEADFANAHLNKANLRGSNLARSNFEKADISETDFGECNLQGANFYQAHAKQTQFGKADLANARMVAINLFGGSLQKANLDSADFQGANLCMVDFMRVKFKNTNVGQANLAKTSMDRWITP